MNGEVISPSCVVLLCRNTEISTTARARIQAFVLVPKQESDSLLLCLSVSFLQHELEERILAACSNNPDH